MQKKRKAQTNALRLRGDKYNDYYFLNPILKLDLECSSEQTVVMLSERVSYFES